MNTVVIKSIEDAVVALEAMKEALTKSKLDFTWSWWWKPLGSPLWKKFISLQMGIYFNLEPAVIEVRLDLLFISFGIEWDRSNARED